MAFGMDLERQKWFWGSPHCRFQARLRRASAKGLDFKWDFRLKVGGFSSVNSSRPADRDPARDNWKPSKPRLCEPSPEFARRSSAASYGSWKPAPLPVPSLSAPGAVTRSPERKSWWTDRKSTRLNSSHSQISYAVFCLKKKNQ